MRAALKFIGCSFFSDKVSKEAPHRGIRYIFLSVLLSLVFLTGGLILAFTVPFKTLYHNSSNIIATVEKTLGENSADRVKLTLSDGKLYCDKIVDTVANADDRLKYGAGADIVIDTRAASAFDDFVAYCVSSSGKEISYEEYLTLDSDVRTLYTFRIRYTGKELVPDDALIAKCEQYLDTCQGIAEKYDEIKKLNDKEYAVAVYELYVSQYYPSLSGYEKSGAPKLRNYYFYNYAECDNILFIFSDSMAGLYKTDSGITQILYGVYTGLPDGEIDGSAEGLDNFILSCTKGGRPYIIYRSVISLFSLLPFLLSAVLCTVAIAYCVYRLQKLDTYRFWEIGKIVCSYMIVASLLAAVGVLCLGFLMRREILNWIEGVLFFGILLIRTGVLVGVDSYRFRKKVKGAASSVATQAQKGENMQAGPSVEPQEASAKTEVCEAVEANTCDNKDIEDTEETK